MKDEIIHGDPEITVIPGDDGDLRLNFCICERVGCEVIRLSDFEDYIKAAEAGEDRERFHLKNRDDIQIGMELALWPTYYIACRGTVEHWGGEFCARSGGQIHCLEFSKDDRKCWVSTVAINEAGIDKIDFS